MLVGFTGTSKHEIMHHLAVWEMKQGGRAPAIVGPDGAEDQGFRLTIPRYIRQVYLL